MRVTPAKAVPSESLDSPVSTFLPYSPIYTMTDDEERVKAEKLAAAKKRVSLPLSWTYVPPRCGEAPDSSR